MVTEKPVTLYLESNPNPNSLKFVISEMLIPEGLTYDFPTPAEAEKSPLAQELFMYPFVERVFFMSNFITITKKDEVDWLEVQDVLKNHILKFLETDRLLIDEQQLAEAEPEESEVITKIKGILEEYIRPAVEQDGGAITFHSYENKVVTVVLQGSCSGCPSSTITLKAGIENLFKKMIPDDVEQVEALNG